MNLEKIIPFISNKKVPLPKTRDEIIFEKIKDSKIYQLFKGGAEILIEQSGDFSASAEGGVNIAKGSASLNKNKGYKFFLRTLPKK